MAPAVPARVCGVAIRIGGRGQWRIERQALKDFIAARYVAAEQERASISAEDD